MPIVKIHYNVELTLYKEEISDSLQNPQDVYSFDEDFQFHLIDFMNEHKNIWFRNLIDTTCMESFDCIKNLNFSLSQGSLCFTIHIDNVDNAEELLESVISDESRFYDTWAACPAWGENKLQLSYDSFYDIFLIPIDKSISLDEDEDLDDEENKVNDMIDKWIIDKCQRDEDMIEDWIYENYQRDVDKIYQ